VRPAAATAAAPPSAWAGRSSNPGQWSACAGAPPGRPPDFIRLFVPELAFYGSDALAQRAGLTLRWATGPASAVFARARWGHHAPVGERMWPDVAPAGARSAWGVAVGAVW
jgi:hypothetical protein